MASKMLAGTMHEDKERCKDVDNEQCKDPVLERCVDQERHKDRYTDPVKKQHKERHTETDNEQCKDPAQEQCVDQDRHADSDTEPNKASTFVKDRIRQIREYLNLSQHAFGERIGRSGNHVSNLEKEYAKPSDETIRRIVATYNIDEMWLRTGQGNMFSGNAPATVKSKTGERIKKVRKQMNLTQTEFADLVGCHKNQVHYVEIGKTKPTDEFLVRVRRACGLSYKWLATGEENGEFKVTQSLIDWLNEHPEEIMALQQKSGLTE